MKAIISSLFLCVAIQTVAQPPIRFKKQIISDERYESVGAFDINGDGKPDLVSGAWWYEGPTFTVRHKIGDVRADGDYFDDFSNIPLDINGDGRLDYITGGWYGNTLRWREQPADPKKEWPEHLLAETGNVETTRAWDVNGDGIPEIVPNNPQHPFKFYRLNHDASGKPMGTFTEHRIHDKQGHGLGFGDVNGDGRNDFVLADGWLEAPQKPLAEPWIWHNDFKLWAASVPILVVDLNGDKRSDLIVGNAHGYGLNWFEQTVTGGWTKHEIDPKHSQYHEMAWVDLDGDQKPELVTGKRYKAHTEGDPGTDDDYGLYYFSWNGRDFIKNSIAFGPKGTGKGTGIYMTITDLNADQRPDIAVAGKDGLWVFFNEGISRPGR